MQVSRSGNTTAAQALVFRELAKLARSVHEMHKAVGDARRATDVRVMMQTRLSIVRDRMPALDAPARQVREVSPELSPEHQRLQRLMFADQGWADGSPIPARTTEPAPAPYYEPEPLGRPERGRDGGRER